MSLKAPREFQVGDRVAYDNFTKVDYGKVVAKYGDNYEIEWEDGFMDALTHDGKVYTYDAWELLHPDEVDG